MLCVVPEGVAAGALDRWTEGQVPSPGQALARGRLVVAAIPFLAQDDYDRLLWASDINFVRGEDSFVRAQWAERPFVWQIYPQAENSHLVKLDAFLTRYLGGCNDSEVVRRCWHAWNGIGDMCTAWRDYLANRQRIDRHGKAWASDLDRMADLADNLARFAREV